MPTFGALPLGRHNSAAQESGFDCNVGGPTTTNSHATISDSGKQTLVCHGHTQLTPSNFCSDTQGACIVSVRCGLRFPDESGQAVVGEGRFIVTPSGEAHLICHSTN